MAFLRKYGVGTGADVYVPIVKRGVVDFAVGADWTPAAGDVKCSLDGGAAANIGTLPTAVAMGNTAYWKFVFADAELQGKSILVTVADSATKAVEDQMFVVETYGHASAKFIADIALANLPANVAQWSGTNVASPATAGYPVVTLKVGTGTGEVNLSSGKAPATIAAGDMATDSITGDAVKADAVTKIQNGLATPTNITAGTITTATNVTTVNGLAENVITAAAIANGAIDAATFAADVDAEILSYIVDDATRIDASALNTASVTTIPAILDDTDLIDDGTSGLAKIATDVAAILVDTGTDIPAQISGIGTAGGAAINVDATTDNAAGGITGVTSGTTKVGTQTGTYTNTSNVNAVYHQIDHAGNAIDWVYQFLTGGGTSVVDARWIGYVNGSNDTVTFYAWNHVGGAWEAIGTQVGQAVVTNVTKSLTLYARHRGTSAAELGKVYVRIACTDQTAPVLYTDQLYVSYAVTSRSVGYADGAVWIDTTTGVAGTESFVNGVADNPVLTLADALTIATAVGLRNFEVANGSTITLAATTSNKVFNGHEWTLALGGQDISSSMFIDAEVSGTGTGTLAEFETCNIGTATIGPSFFWECSFSGTLTLGAAGDYFFYNCHSAVPGTGTPVVDLATAGANNLSFRRWSGGLTLNNISSNDVISIDVVSGGTITLNGADGNVQLRGMCSSVVDNRTGSPTLGKSAVVNQTLLATPTNITAGTITTVTNLTNLPSIPADWITTAGIADGAFTAAKFAAGAFDAVWSVTARLLTAGTNIVLAKGVGVTGFNDLSASQINTQCDTALADYDGPTNTEMEARTLLAASYATATALSSVNTKLGTAAGASMSADIAAVKSDTGTLVTKLTTGITSLAQWLGLIAGKQTGDSTARTELRATGAGSGTFDETTDSLEAVADGGGGGGGGGLTFDQIFNGDTLTELTSSDCPAEPTPGQALMLAYMRIRNDSHATGGTTNKSRDVRNNAGTVILEADVTYDASSRELSQGKLGAPD